MLLLLLGGVVVLKRLCPLAGLAVAHLQHHMAPVLVGSGPGIEMHGEGSRGQTNGLLDVIDVAVDRLDGDVVVARGSLAAAPHLVSAADDDDATQVVVDGLVAGSTTGATPAGRTVRIRHAVALIRYQVTFKVAVQQG